MTTRISLAVIILAGIPAYPEIVIHTKDGRQIRVQVDSSEISRIDFTSPDRGPDSNGTSANLPGLWSWTCCGGLHSGTFRLSNIGSNGSFSGRFGSGPSDGQSPISGRITGDRVQFTRTILVDGKRVGDQQWSARLVYSGNNWVLTEGKWQGFGGDSNSDGFSATKAQ
jgi:hypothetical protein